MFCSHFVYCLWRRVLYAGADWLSLSASQTVVKDQSSARNGPYWAVLSQPPELFYWAVLRQPPELFHWAVLRQPPELYYWAVLRQPPELFFFFYWAVFKQPRNCFNGYTTGQLSDRVQRTKGYLERLNTTLAELRWMFHMNLQFSLPHKRDYNCWRQCCFLRLEENNSVIELIHADGKRKRKWTIFRTVNIKKKNRRRERIGIKLFGRQWNACL